MVILTTVCGGIGGGKKYQKVRENFYDITISNILCALELDK